MLGFAALLAFTVLLFTQIPKGFVPTEDQGYFIVVAQGPEGASPDYMTRVLEKIEGIMIKEKEVVGVFGINGFGFGGNAANKVLAFVPMHPIGQREGHHHSMQAVIERTRGQLMGITEAIVIPFEPPAVRGIGSTGGFSFQLQERSGTQPLSELAKAQFQLWGEAGNPKSGLTGVFATFNTDSPLLRVKVDREKARSLGVALDEVFGTIQTMMGSLYLNDFTYNNRVYRVVAQADAPFRNNPEALNQFYVKSRNDQMVPLQSMIEVKEDSGPQIISHFNLFRSTEINGSPAPGVSSGQAQKKMEELASHLPKGFGYEWSGLYLEQSQSGAQTLLFLGLGIVFVFLVLAAQYESYVDPFIIILSVPLAMLGALLAIQVRGLSNDIFCQVGMVLLVGLASKNAILIVEFANQLLHQGKNVVQAAMEAAIIRFRPIMMTSFAFIIGVLPLVFAEGAGAAARQSLGTAVFGGMLVSTLLSLVVVPVLFILIKGLFYKRPVVPGGSQPRH
jgi:hydrophobic/amphiphilic exporter-1 (mainly G- bacteria), HAE1 family